MGDVAEKRVGNRTYRVFGLQARAEDIRTAARAVSEAITATTRAARTAVDDWRGPHAEAFLTRVNSVLPAMVTLQLAGETAASRCSRFPSESSYGSAGNRYAYDGVRISAPDAGSTVSASPSVLRAYATAANDDTGCYAALAGAVTTDGLTADVSVFGPLSSEERARWRANGVPSDEIESAREWSDPEPVAVTEVFTLPDLAGQAATVRTSVVDLATWVSAVAVAVEDADGALARLLLAHPELAGYFDRSSKTEGRMSGDAALALILANIAAYDIAAGDDRPDNVVGLEDLRAMADDPNADEHLRAAAQYLLDNRLLLSQASIADQSTSYETRPSAARLTPEGISLFLRYNAAIRAVGLDFGRLDVAAQHDEPDGHVSVEDLEAAVADARLPQSLRDAAAFLLANGALTQRLARYGTANYDRITGNLFSETSLGTEPSGFDYEAVVALAIDQQAYGGDPAAAHRFVASLPLAQRDGSGGLSLFLVLDEGVKALANAALLDVRHDLSGQHEVIAHLPETINGHFDIGAVRQQGGVRNQLITGFYDVLAKRADELFAGPDLAGRPAVPGHPGANWLMFAPWASNSVGGVINGRTTGPAGFMTSSIQQGAADGNQWIFHDIGGRFSAFLEMHEQHPKPSEAQLERFFSDSFGPGDATIRTAFAAYVAANETDDPRRRQQLMFEANTLVATHEQAGAQPYIERMTLSPIPGNWTVGFFPPIQVGGAELRVNDDIPERGTANNLVVDSPLLSLDTGGQTARDYSTEAVRFAAPDAPRTSPAIDLAPLDGIEAFRPDFSPSTTVWLEQGGGDPADPEDLAGSGASSWPDWNERMYTILRMFEQFHTDPSLFDTTTIEDSLPHDEWLDPEARPGG